MCFKTDFIEYFLNEDHFIFREMPISEDIKFMITVFT